MSKNKFKIETTVMEAIIQEALSQNYFKKAILKESNGKSNLSVLNEAISYQNLSKVILEAVLNSEDLQFGLKTGDITVEDAIKLSANRLSNYLFEESLKRASSESFVKMLREEIDRIK